MAGIKNLIFFGTPAFALPTLDALDEGGFTPSLVVSQPTRPAGRGQDPKDPPVVEWAREHDVEVVQPENVSDEAFLDDLEARKPDLIVVVAFGQVFPERLLEMPRLGCINVHASLLPKYRGASPIQGVLMNGEKKTGITIMRMEETLDTGPIIDQVDTEIRPWETAEELTPRMAKLGAKLLVSVVERWDQGKKIKERKQREESSSYSPLISKSDGKVNWALRAEEIYNRLRAFTPWPGMKANFRGDPLKLVWGVPVEWEQAPIGVTGTFLGMRQGRIAVLCGDSTILGIEELQRPGKKLVRATDFVNGERLRVGERFS